MITVFNADNYAQQWFFDKAFAVLKAKGNILTSQEEELGRFLNLDGYFAHMKDLIEVSPTYVLIPSDEEPFEINANTRTISIPANFSKCAGVVGDDMCEIITFTVDRYFDYVDLATTNICVQWNTKDGKKGISHINLIDLETVPGKIRFGWPLTKELTEKAGQINFAVRFFSSQENGAIVYVLNTLPTVISIKDSLNINKNDEAVIIENNVTNIFNAFIQNSNNPTYPTPAPISWGYPGLDLEQYGSIDAINNTLVLRGQGVVADNGHVVYNWYFEDGNTKEEIKVDTNDERFNIAEEYVLIDPRPTSRVGSEQYFKKEADEALGYTLITTKELPDIDLYERITTLTIVDSERQDITGRYRIGAKNYIGADTVNITDDLVIQAMNSTTESFSKYCTVLTPANLLFKENGNLKENLFLKNGKGDLKIETDAGAGNPTVTYTWSFRGRDDKEFADLANKGTSLEVTTPGWYKAKIKSLLNRQEKELESEVCRVINDPAKPQLNSMEYIRLAELNKDGDLAIWNQVSADTDMGQEVASAPGDTFALRVNTNFDGINNLLDSDEIKYEWYVITPDMKEGSAGRLITIDDADPLNNGLVVAGTPVDTNRLDVRCVENDTKYSYYCKVTNVLADKEAVFDLSDYDVIFKIW